MPSVCSLTRIPSELRRQIFLNVVSTSPCARALLAALRPTHKNSSLYSEAIQAYYDVRTCTISDRNNKSIANLRPEIQKMLRILHLEFSIHHTTHSPPRFRRRFRYTTSPDAAGARMTLHSCVHEAITHTRIHPAPSFTTAIAPFARLLRVLSLDVRSVPAARFHQIEALVRCAVGVCERLERVEVGRAWDGGGGGGEDGGWAMGRGAGAKDGGDEKDGNRLWIERLNRGMRVKAKLRVVDSAGVSWPWFWQAEEGKTLTWREK